MRVFPTRARQRCANFADIQIGDCDDMIAGDLARLCQHHGAEFPGANKSDADRASGRVSGGKHG